MSVPRCLRVRAEAVPKAARSVPARKGPCLGSEGTALVPGRRGRSPDADGQVAVVRLGTTAAAADWPVPVHSEAGWAVRRRPGGSSARCGARGGKSGRRWRRRRPGGLRALGSEGRDPPLPGRRETAPEILVRVYRAARLRLSLGGRESGQPELERVQACRWLLPGGEVRLSR